MCLLASCADVKFYSDPALTQKTGLKFHQPKPYVLVTKTGNKESPTKVEVIYLPDLSTPNFAVYKPGWGKHKFSLTLANGILTQYGQETDSQGPETIKAIADLASQGATAFKTFKEAQRLESAEIDAAKGAVQAAMGYLATFLQNPGLANFPQFKSTAQELIDRLRKVEVGLDTDALGQQSTLKGIAKDIEASRIKDAQGVENALSLNNLLDLSHTQVTKAIEILGDLKPTAPEPDFLLFELDMSNGKTSLIPVSPSVIKSVPQGK